MRELRARLDDMMGRQGAQALTRVNAICLLRAISDGLKPSTDKTVGHVDDGIIVTDHPALALLDDLIDALTDLDNGKTHDVFKVLPYAPNASLTTKERKSDDVILKTVLVVKRAKGYKTRKEAEKFLADRLNKAGKKRRGQRYTVKMLKRLRDDRKKRT
jgi:hypothetical protein